jgi:hypothetical protein
MQHQHLLLLRVMAMMRQPGAARDASRCGGRAACAAADEVVLLVQHHEL